MARVSSTSNSVDRQHKLTGDVRTRVELIRELAVGELTFIALAKKYGVTSPSINGFAKKHAEEIARQRADLEDRVANLWIAQKYARIAEYQRSAEIAIAEIDKALAGRLIIGKEDPDTEDMEDGATPAADVSGPIARYARIRDRALRSVAEELGQLPQRTTFLMEKTTIRHIVEGVDVDKL